METYLGLSNYPEEENPWGSELRLVGAAQGSLEMLENRPPPIAHGWIRRAGIGVLPRSFEIFGLSICSTTHSAEVLRPAIQSSRTQSR